MPQPFPPPPATPATPATTSVPLAADRHRIVRAGQPWPAPPCRCCGAAAALQASEGLNFFFSTDWNPVENKYGALAPIYGTLVTAIIAMVIAVPVSFGIAFFLTEVAPRWMRGPVGTAIELLAGIPSIIYGMWGLFVLMPVMTRSTHPVPRRTPRPAADHRRRCSAARRSAPAC